MIQSCFKSITLREEGKEGEGGGEKKRECTSHLFQIKLNIIKLDIIKVCHNMIT